MSYDPTQQVPPPQEYPPQGGYTQQGYPQQPGYPSAYPQQTPPTPPTYPQYSGGPAPTGAGFDFNAFWKKLGTTGQVCSIAGIVLFISLLLPWITVSVAGFGSASANGWSVATNGGGTDTGSSFIFTMVWLVILASLALIVFPILSALGKLNARQGQMFVLIAAGVALVVEIIYMIRAFTLTQSTSDGLGTVFSVSVAPGFGFWVGLLATLAAGGIYIYYSRIKKPAMGGMPVGGYQQPYEQQYPGSQPYPPQTPYPGSQPYQQPGQYPGSQPPQYPGQ
jgi:hypothetical protein